jgi:hypothetical protein
MRNLRRPSPSLVISIVALVVALGGTGYAAVTVTGKQIKDSSITGRDVKNKSLTKKDFKGSVAGPRGATGAQGAKGDKGDMGGTPPTQLWAVVASDGTTTHGRGVVSSAQLGPGQYEVIFNQDVSACAPTVTPGGPSTEFDEAFASPRKANANGVFVEIKNSGTTDRTDRNFNLAVPC